MGIAILSQGYSSVYGVTIVMMLIKVGKVMMMLRLMVMLIMMVVVSRCTGSGDGFVVITMLTHGNYETDMGYFKSTSSNSNVRG